MTEIPEWLLHRKRRRTLDQQKRAEARRKLLMRYQEAWKDLDTNVPMPGPLPVILSAPPKRAGDLTPDELADLIVSRLAEAMLNGLHDRPGAS